MNTRIKYEYRDGANYRFHGDIIVRGEMNEQLWRRLRKTQDPDTEGFIAHQVLLPEVFGYLPGDHIGDATHPDGYPYDDKNDHCWHRLCENGWELVSSKPTDNRSVNDLVKAFEAAKHQGWKPFDPKTRFKKQ